LLGVLSVFYKEFILKKAFVFPVVLLGTVLAACSQKSLDTTSPFKPTASIQDIMVSIIDPNIDFVWNSVATISTSKGTEERRPQTDEEWKTVRQHALTVLEASNLLLVEGRKAAGSNASTSSHPVELNPKEIDKAINDNREDYIRFIHALHDATQQAITAIDAKNVDELVKAGGLIDQVCEQCHSKFWYPNDKRPQ
jgi:hypothetical protein